MHRTKKFFTYCLGAHSIIAVFRKASSWTLPSDSISPSCVLILFLIFWLYLGCYKLLCASFQSCSSVLTYHLPVSHTAPAIVHASVLQPDATDPTIEALKSALPNLVIIHRAFSVSIMPLIIALLVWACLNYTVLESDSITLFLWPENLPCCA